MSGDKLHRLQREVADLSVFLHTEMSSIPKEDGEGEQLDLTAVLRLPPSDALLHIKRCISSLLKFKRDILLSREYSDFQTTHQYQSALQKLESEVRNHIKIEQQLKIHIENIHSRVEDTERENERLKKDLKTAKEAINFEENAGKREKFMQENLQLRHLSKRDQNRAAEMEKVIERLEEDNEARKTEVAERTKECERLSRDVERYKTMVSHMKENIQCAGEGGKKSFYGYETASREEGRSASPFGLSTLSQRNIKAAPQRSSSSERLKGGSRPLTATRRVNGTRK